MANPIARRPRAIVRIDLVMLLPKMPSILSRTEVSLDGIELVCADKLTVVKDINSRVDAAFLRDLNLFTMLT